MSSGSGRKMVEAKRKFMEEIVANLYFSDQAAVVEWIEMDLNTGRGSLKENNRGAFTREHAFLNGDNASFEKWCRAGIFCRVKGAEETFGLPLI
jgi:hypothetical protein